LAHDGMWQYMCRSVQNLAAVIRVGHFNNMRRLVQVIKFMTEWN
jgi:hypothetical protein